MQLIRFVGLLLCFGTMQNGFAQNAFYYTKRIVQWRDSAQIISQLAGLDATEMLARQQPFIDSINAVVFYYAGQGSWQKFKGYPIMDSLYNTLFRFTTRLNFIDRLIMEWENSNKKPEPKAAATLKNLRNRLGQLRQADSTLAAQINALNALAHNLETLKESIPDSSLYVLGKPVIVSTLQLDSIKIIQQQLSQRRTYLLQPQMDSASEALQLFTTTDEYRNLYHALYSGKRITQLVQVSKIGLSGLGYNNNIRNQIEQTAQQVLFANRDALPPLKNFSLPSQAEVIDALAIYLAKRVKQEMVLSFTDQLKKSLKTDSLLTAFFPETRKLFMSLPTQEFARFGAGWRYAISKDFVQLPDNLIKYPKTSEWLGMYYPIFYDSYQMATLINKKYNFVDMIEELADRSLDPNAKDTLKSMPIQQFVQIMRVLNKEVFNAQNNGLYWLDGDLWNNITAEEFEIFWALVNERYPKLNALIHYSRAESKYNLLPNTVQSIRMWMKRVLFALNKFQADQQELLSQVEKQKQDSELKWEFRLATYWDNVHDIINMVITNPLINVPYQKQAQQLMTLNDGLFNVFESIQQRSFVAAVNETLGLLETYVKNPQPLAPHTLTNLVNNTSSFYDYLDSNYNTLTLQGNPIKPSQVFMLSINQPAALDSLNEHNTHYFNRVLQSLGNEFGLLKGLELDAQHQLVMTAANELYAKIYPNQMLARLNVARRAAAIFQDIILAKGSAELSTVIEKYAMPVGSYKVKRRSPWSVDLNAYFGLYGGYEWIQSSALGNSAKGGWVVGLTAPIGFSFSWAAFAKGYAAEADNHYSLKKGIRRYRGSSHTISATIIDIGAVVSYRLSNNADKPLPASVTWGQVVAPGLAYRLGLKNTPLCLHLGMQYAPQLRTINQLKYQNTLRSTLGLTFDLPLINLAKGQ